MPIHLRPNAPLAPRVLLPGDPGRAMLLARDLLDEPKMFNHHRGLWGYTGRARDDELLTIQSTGMGGPSTAIVVAELTDLGAKRLVRVGTCGALHPSLRLGDLLVAREAISSDGTSRALGTADRIAPTTSLLDALLAATEGSSGAHAGAVASTDLFYDAPPGEEERWIAAGAVAVEMEAATLFALAAKRGFEAAALLIVSDLLVPSRVRIDDDALHEAEHRLGRTALRALAPAHETATA